MAGVQFCTAGINSSWKNDTISVMLIRGMEFFQKQLSEGHIEKPINIVTFYIEDISRPVHYVAGCRYNVQLCPGFLLNAGVHFIDRFEFINSDPIFFLKVYRSPHHEHSSGQANRSGLILSHSFW